MTRHPFGPKRQRMEQVQENVRDTWSWSGLDDFVRDVRHAARSLDFITYAGVVGVLAIAATLAMLLPAVRAATIDPLIALRHE